MVTVNGEQKELAGSLVSEIIAHYGYNRETIAVEVNGDIVPKSLYDTFAVSDGDNVIIVGFVGGG